MFDWKNVCVGKGNVFGETHTLCCHYRNAPLGGPERAVTNKYRSDHILGMAL